MPRPATRTDPDPPEAEGADAPVTADDAPGDDTGDHPGSDTDRDGDLEAAPTKDVLRGLAHGLGRLGETLGKTAASVGTGAKAAGRKATETAEELALKERATAAGHALATAGGMTAAGAKKAAGAAAEAGAVVRTTGTTLYRRTSDGLVELIDHLDRGRTELANRTTAAHAAGVDFYDRHREEILGLLITAAKVVAVIGIRRMTAPRPGPDGTVPPARRRVKEASRVVFAISAEIGRLIAKNPSGLPLLRERFAHGDEAEQAVVGMVLGPALSEDPDYALAVIEEFLGDARSDAAADTIARRSLAPLLADHPELAGRVKDWTVATRPFVRRGALVALERHLHDPHSRIGDALAAAVLVLEDHDEEVRQAVGWLLRAAASRDLDTTARTLARRLDESGGEASPGLRGLLDRLPDLARAVAARRTRRD